MKLHKHGKNYRLRLKDGDKWVWVNLGSDERAATEKAEDLLGISINNFTKAARRYREEVLYTKSPKTYVVQDRQLDKLITHFGHFPLEAIEPHHAIEYLDHYGNVSANREIALMRHVLTKCRHWGMLKINPFLSLQYRNPEGRRDRVVDYRELKFVMKRANARERYLMWLVYLTGLRREDALSITDMSFRDGFLHVTEGKTGKKVRIEVSPSLAKVRAKLAPLYFQGISESGIDSAWQRLRKKLQPYELFQLKDLRAAYAGEIEDQGGDATKSLGHSSRTVTQNHYLRNGRINKPSR